MQSPLLQSSFLHEERASALLTVLIVMTVLLTLIGTVMAVYHVQHQFIQQDIQAMQAYHTAEGGLHYALGQLKQDRSWRPEQQPYPCASEDATCTLSMEAYGGYWRVAAHAGEGTRATALQAFIGARPPAAFQQAVVLTGDQSDLTLAGDTRIRGDVYNARAQVRDAPLGQTSFTGSFDGDAYAIDAQTEPVFTGSALQATLVRLHEQLILPPTRAQPIAGDLRGAPESVAPQYVLAEGNTVLTAADTAITRSSSVVIVQGNLTIQGPLDVHDTSQFIVRDTLSVHRRPGPDAGSQSSAQDAQRSDARGSGVVGRRALLYAGKHVDLSGWSGDAQVLSGGSIRIGNATRLTYPSLVYVGRRTAPLEVNEQADRPIEPSEAPRHIDIQGDATIDGTVILDRPDSNDDDNRFSRDERIQVGPHARIRGAVYSTTVTTLQGRVSGTVATDQFCFYRSPTSYVNWVFGGAINVQERPAPYVMPVDFSEAPGDNLALVHWSQDRSLLSSDE